MPKSLLRRTVKSGLQTEVRILAARLVKFVEFITIDTSFCVDNMYLKLEIYSVQLLQETTQLIWIG